MSDPRSHGGDPADAFHLVIPSLPGFAFSGPTRRAGDADTLKFAEVIAGLMAELGYDRYGAQGGDIGAFVSPDLGRMDTEHVVGVHVNGLLTFPSWDGDDSEYTEVDRERLQRMEESSQQETGYAIIQSTRPQTLSFGLTDSPAGQLAWIVEKFKTWTDPAHELPEQAVDRDQMLTNVSIYWFTATAGSSARLYRESSRWGKQAEKSGVPTAVAVFPNDFTVRTIADKEHNIVQWNEFDRGGHFAAMEAPDLLVDDIRTFFQQVR